ncbi:MAG: sugar kinase [Clostridiaceae bacterium]
MSEVITIGEPLTLFAASGESESDKDLSEVRHFEKYLAGAEVNVCIGLSRLGHSVEYITKLGEDPFGEFIRKSLKKEMVGTSYISSTDCHPTGFMLKSKVSIGDPEIFYFRRNSAASKFGVSDLDSLDLSEVKHLYLSGIFPALSENTRGSVYKLLAAAKEYGIPITFDPNLRLQLWKSKEEMIDTINDLAFSCDYVLPGIKEGLILAGSDNKEEIADFYLSKGVKAVIIKLGEQGAFVKTRESSCMVKGVKVEKVIDTVGAGDGFAAGLISGLLEGLSIVDSVKRGNVIGAFAVMSPGDNDGYPSKKQLMEFINNL